MHRHKKLHNKNEIAEGSIKNQKNIRPKTDAKTAAALRWKQITESELLQISEFIVLLLFNSGAVNFQKINEINEFALLY